MADNTNSGNSGGDQNNTPLPNMDYGPPVLDHPQTSRPPHGDPSASAQDNQTPLPNMDYGPPVIDQPNTTSPTGTDSNPIDITDTGTTTATDEPFVGSGGVGSPEYMEALRRAHEQAGGEYTSDLQSHDDSQGGTGSGSA